MTSESGIRVYADTSVYGGFFDEEFAAPTQFFFQQVREERFRLVDSPLIEDELAEAPEAVRSLHQEFSMRGETATLNQEAVQLQLAYIEAGVVSPKWEVDALHVALATVLGCEIVVSWNFKHIVHYEKIEGYNEVNVANGYGPIRIHTPQEVISYED